MKLNSQTEYKCCYGISSATQDNRHIFMLDCDKDEYYDKFKFDLLEVQQIYDLNDIYIIKSTNGFNALSLDKLPITIIYNLGLNCPVVDKHFIHFGFRRNYFVLRFDMDKILHETLKNISSKHEKSKGHALFLNLFFGLNIELKKNNFDDYTTIDLIQYPSDKNGYHKIEMSLNER